MAHLPSADFATNQAWLTAVCRTGDLLAWFRGLCLTGRWRRATPARLRDALFHTAGRLIRSGRRVVVRLAARWPWAALLMAAVTCCQHLVVCRNRRGLPGPPRALLPRLPTRCLAVPFPGSTTTTEPPPVVFKRLTDGARGLPALPGRAPLLHPVLNTVRDALLKDLD